MEIEIYTNVGCGWCKKAKQLMERMDTPYTEYRIGRDITREEFIEKLNLRGASYPQIVVDKELVGGLTEAVRFFVDKGMVSKSK